MYKLNLTEDEFYSIRQLVDIQIMKEEQNLARIKMVQNETKEPKNIKRLDEVIETLRSEIKELKTIIEKTDRAYAVKHEKEESA